MKTCTNCKTSKKLEEFHKNRKSKDGSTSWCKTCANTSSKAWNKVNLEKAKDFKLKRRYGISFEDYCQLLRRQNGTCAICKNPENYFDYRTKKLKLLSVDHDHKNGNVRGLLCEPCNKALGLFKDNIDALNRAVKYLTDGGATWTLL